MDDGMQRRSDLTVHSIAVETGKSPQRFESSRHIGRRIRMDRTAAALMPGVQSRQQIHHLSSPDLTDNETIGTHPQSLANEISQGDLSATLDIRWSGLQPHDMWMIRAQLARVLDQHQPLRGSDQREQRVEQRRLSRTRAAADQERQARIEQIPQYRRTG